MYQKFFFPICFEDIQGEDFVESYDNGLLLTGKHGSNYVHYLWLIKTDINGQMLWEKTFGEPNSYIGLFRLSANNKGDIFIAGGTTYYDSFSDPLILKLNSCSEKEWCRVFNSPEHYDYAHSIVATDDGGCVAILRYTGATYGIDRICLVKFDPDGNLKWKQCYNSSDTNILNQDSRSLLKTKDKGFLITGTCGYLDVDSTHLYWQKHYYIKTDSLGNLEWETVVHSDYNLAGGDAWTTTINPDSSYYYSSVSHYDYQTNYSSPALIKLDLEGNVIAIFDIVSGYINGGLAYAQFINDSVMAADCGWGNTITDIVDYAVLIDTSGNIINMTELVQDIYGSTLQVTFDQKLVYMYSTNPNGQFDVYLRKLNLNLEDDTLYTLPFTYDSLCPYQIVSDTIVQDDCGLIVGIEENQETWGPGEEGKLLIWPNPASEGLSVKCLGLSSGTDCSLVIYDIFGRITFSLLRQPAERAGDGGWSWQVDVSSLPPGIYLAVVKDKKTVLGTGKFVVVDH